MNIRYHHIGTFYTLCYNFNEWVKEKGIEGLSFSTAYQQPEIVGAFVQEFVDKKTVEAVQIARGEGRDHRGHNVDYVGENGKDAETYRQGLTLFYTVLMTSSPDTEVVMGYGYDDICRSNGRKSQDASKPENHEVGVHCANEFGGLHDYQVDRTLQELFTSPHVPEVYWERVNTVILPNSQGPAAVAPLGVFRDEEFLEAFGERYKEVSKETMENMWALRELKILSGSIREAKVTESYLRGERGW